MPEIILTKTILARSVYPSQVLSQTRSSSHKVITGSEMRDTGKIGFQTRSRTASSIILTGVETIKKKFPGMQK